MTDDEDARSPQQAWTSAERARFRTWAEATPSTELTARFEAIANRPKLDPTVPHPTTARSSPVGGRSLGKRAAIAAFIATVAATAFVVGRVSLHTPSTTARGEVESIPVRRSIEIGHRGIAVAGAGASLAWLVDNAGVADVVQREGSVFYRVERGGAFVVHTPAGDVLVTGTCFNVEIKMNSIRQTVGSGVIGAVVAAAVVVTVYEGGVVVAHGSQRTAVGPGQSVSLPSQPTAVATSATGSATSGTSPTTTTTSAATAAGPGSASGELGRLSADELRVRVTQLEAKLAEATRAAPEKYAGIHPNAETLQAWAKDCTIRIDTPPYEDLDPHVEEKAGPRIGAGDLPAYNAALAEVHGKWLVALRAAYLEVTGDQARVNTLEPAAMRREIAIKSGGDMDVLRARIANERAGNVEPAAPGTPMTALERYFRIEAALGDDTEAALARRIGAERAKQIRGEDGWWNRNGFVTGCPEK